MPPKTSATTRPFQPSAKQYRAAANRNGISDGISTWRMTRCRGTSKARAMSNRSAGVFRTPSRTLMITNGMPVSTTVMIGPVSPKPKARLQNSAQARFGMARIATTQSLKNASTALDSPIARPMIVPRIRAMTMPMAKPLQRDRERLVQVVRSHASRQGDLVPHELEHLPRCRQHVDGERPDGGDQLDRQQPEGEADEAGTAAGRVQRAVRPDTVRSIRSMVRHRSPRAVMTSSSPRQAKNRRSMRLEHDLVEEQREHDRTPGSRSGTRRAGKAVSPFASRSRCPWMRRTPRSAP